MPNNDSENTTLDLSALKEKLLAQRTQLQQDLEVSQREIAEEGDELVQESGVSNHMADEATDMADTETEMAIENATQHELNLVEQALARIEAGTYGTCNNCGKPINPDRLEARPAAQYDIECQELADRGLI